MPLPFVCTNNSLGNIDYGIPILASKSTDYRTTANSFHRLVPNKAQEFDCRVRAKIKPELKTSNVKIRDETIHSTYGYSYTWKQNDTSASTPTPSRNDKVNYNRTIQERITKIMPPMKGMEISEMKEQFSGRDVTFAHREVFPPEPYSMCEIKALGRDEQPAMRPEEPGFWKLMDPYLTTYRCTHIPFTANQQNGVARKDIATFYDVNNCPKVKGFGPRDGPAVQPLVCRRKIPMTDKMPFKLHPFEGRIRKVTKAVPNFGSKSEYQGKYVLQSYSNMFPYLFENGVEYPESLPDSCAWQELSPPGMYCSEYCNIGSGWPVNGIIDYGLPKKYPLHKPCYNKFCDWSQ